MKLRGSLSPFFLLCVVIPAWPASASAAWPATGRALGDGFKSQEVVDLVPGDAHSAFVVRAPMELPAPDGLHAHRLTSAGTTWPGWPDSGVAFASNLIRFAEDVSVCSDGAGGVFVVWAGSTASRVSSAFITRIGADGSFPTGWSSAGMQIGSGPGFDITPRVVPDGGGGAIAVWSRVAAPPSFPIVAQRVTAEGLASVAWPDTGRWVSGAPGIKFVDELIPDGEGGAIAAWTVSDRVGLQRVTSGGIIPAGWPVDGILAGSGTGPQSTPQLALGTSGTFFVAWSDGRGTVTTPRAAPYLLHFETDSAISAGWPIDGLRLSIPDASLSDLLPAEAGDVYAAWVSDRLRVQRVTATAATSPSWSASAVPVSTTPSAGEVHARLAPDSEDGVLVTWTKSAAPGGVFAQRVRADGVVDAVWPPAGVPVRLAPEAQRPFIASDGMSGAFVAWLDVQDGSGSSEAFLQRLGPDGTTGSVVGVVAAPRTAALHLSAPLPNPSRARTRVELTLPQAASVSAMVMDVGGRAVRSLCHDALLAAGRATLDWDGLDDDGKPAGAGLYFIHVRSAQGVAVSRCVRLR